MPNIVLVRREKRVYIERKRAIAPILDLQISLSDSFLIFNSAEVMVIGRINISLFPTCAKGAASYLYLPGKATMMMNRRGRKGAND